MPPPPPRFRRIDTTSRFGKPSHHYETPEGRHIPGVTTLIGDGIPKPLLVGWAANTTAEYAVDNWAELAELTPTARLTRLKRARYETSDAAAHRGTEVHDYAARLIHGEAVTPPPELLAHIEAYVRFLDEWRVTPILVESAIYNPEGVSHDRAGNGYASGYAGTLDLVAEIGGVHYLLDVKTGKRVYPEVALQLAAYRYADTYLTPEGAEAPMSSLGITRCGVVHVTAEGYTLVPVTAGEQEYESFLLAADMALWQKLAPRLIHPPAERPEEPHP